jgi:dipeptidyl aminopeptidase/acylaminoacyl peptidase
MHTRLRPVVPLSAVLILSSVAPVPVASRQWTPDLMMTVKRVTGVQVSPDAQRAAFVVARAVMEGEKSEWLSQIHVANADGSNAFQLTRGERSSTSPQWSPDGRWIAFLSSRGADEGRDGLFRIRVDGGEAEALTAEKGAISEFRWSPDGRSIAFVMTDPRTDEEEKAAKDKRDMRIIDETFKLARLYVIPVEADASGKRPARRLTGDHHVTDFDWSPDAARIAFSFQRTPKVFEPNDVSVVDLAGGAVRPIAAAGAHEDQPRFSPDSRSIAYVTSDDPPTWAFTGWVRVVAAEGGAARALGPTLDEQPSLLGWSADGQRILYQETKGTAGQVFALPAGGGAPAAVSTAQVHVTGASLNATRTALGFTHAWADRAPEAYTSRLDRFDARQASRVQELPGVTGEDGAPLGRTDAIAWKAPDGQAVEGLVTYPVGYERGTRVPLLVIVHGGPTGVFTQSFIGTPGPYPIAAFAARGYAVLRCNVRGSSGYGRKFRYANYQDWGGGDYRDIMAGVDHLVQIGVADPDRLGVMGWSYGGFMTSWIITQTKRFKAASVGAGVTNLMSFAGTSDIPGFSPDYFGGEYWDVFDRWRTHSAMFNVKGVTTPTLILHGEVDERVPVSQGYELHNALVRQKVPTRMVVYPRQHHGFHEPKMTKDAMERNLDWFDRWMGRNGTSSE